MLFTYILHRFFLSPYSFFHKKLLLTISFIFFSFDPYDQQQQEKKQRGEGESTWCFLILDSISSAMIILIATGGCTDLLFILPFIVFAPYVCYPSSIISNYLPLYLPSVLLMISADIIPLFLPLL
jgi:hypothetical protein